MAAATATAGLAAVGCLVVKEFSSQAFSLAVSHLGDVMSQLNRKPDDATRLIHKELIALVPTAKLKIIHAMLFDFEWLREESKTVDSLCDRLTELAQSINYHTQQIGIALDHFNQLYFRSWRTLDISPNLEAIKRDVHHLNETFEVLKIMLPSCVLLVNNRRTSNKAHHPLPQLPAIKSPKPSPVLLLHPPETHK